MEMDSPDSDPFAGLGADAESRKPLPMQRTELLRRIIAGAIFFLGMVEIATSVILGMNFELPRWQVRGLVLIGIGICTVACAVYDGRIFGARKRRR
jgi:hypothetical protein